MTEVRFEERDPGQSAIESRILAWGDRLRLDYGQDGEDFILHDRPEGITWHVSRQGRRLVGIVSSPARHDWPADWTVSRDQYPSGENIITRIRANDLLCAEFKTGPQLAEAARLMSSYRRALAGNRAQAWSGMPEASRHPCILLLDVREAGIEYRQGMPLAVRYWDGRSRVYRGHEVRPARPELFELPAGYARQMVGPAQGKDTRRQPVRSQRR